MKNAATPLRNPRPGRGSVIVFLLIFGSACSARTEQKAVQIAAAASLTDVLQKIVIEYRAVHPRAIVNMTLSASGILAHQIEQGGPVDIYISANPRWMEYLVGKKRVRREQIRNFAGNTLVLVGCRNRPLKSLGELRQFRRIAIGTPESVPAGEYARQALERAGLYRPLAGEGRLIFTRDVRQALAYADQNVVDAAFVYGSDTLLLTRAIPLLKLRAESHEPITYPMALTVRGSSRPEVVAFFRFLQNETVGKILRDGGFRTYDPSPAGDRRRR